MSETLYSPLVRELFRNPRSAGVLAPAPDVIAGEAGNIQTGAWVRFSVRVRDGLVTDARFKAYGCPHTLAAAAWVAEHLVGRRLDDAFPEGAAGLAQVLEAPAEKLGRLLIVEDALRDCLRHA